MARLPLSTRFARMLLFANQHNLMPYAVVLVAALSVPDFFLPDIQQLSTSTNDSLPVVGLKRNRAQTSDANRAAQIRINFLRQFVKTVNVIRIYVPLLVCYVISYVRTSLDIVMLFFRNCFLGFKLFNCANI